MWVSLFDEVSAFLFLIPLNVKENLLMGFKGSWNNLGDFLEGESVLEKIGFYYFWIILA